VIYTGGVIFEAGPTARTCTTYRKLVILTPLPLPRVVLIGPRAWRFCRDSQPNPNCWAVNRYDFTNDVRELVLERLRFDVYAEWSDPREWASVARRSTR